MRLSIIGLGGIGASVGLAIKAHRLPLQIMGYDLRREVMEEAHARGVIDAPCPTLEACAEADLILLATPPRAIYDCLLQLAPRLKPDTILTDVASVKAPVLAWAQELLPYPEQFIGGHPIAGTEQSGLQAARADLFEDAPWVLTPTVQTNPDALQQVEALVQSLGAIPTRLNAEQHDREFALLSFLPHCIAFSLIALQQEHPTQLPGGRSWRDATRVAASDPELWTELLILNRQNTLEYLNALTHRLRELAELLAQADAEQIRAFLRAGSVRYTPRG